MTLSAAAGRAKVDESYLSRIERGERLPSLRLLARLAEVYGAEQLARELGPYVRGVDG
jgi:transcriptional regulator with XRE-family HTH domain